MATEPTSIDAHIAVEETGEAQRQRDIVLAYILDEHPRTGREAERDTGIQGAWRRLSELKKERKIQHGRDLRCCTVTGSDVIGWIPVGEDGIVYTRPSPWPLECFVVVTREQTIWFKKNERAEAIQCCEQEDGTEVLEVKGRRIFPLKHKMAKPAS